MDLIPSTIFLNLDSPTKLSPMLKNEKSCRYIIRPILWTRSPNYFSLFKIFQIGKWKIYKILGIKFFKCSFFLPSLPYPFSSLQPSIPPSFPSSLHLVFLPFLLSSGLALLLALYSGVTSEGQDRYYMGCLGSNPDDYMQIKHLTHQPQYLSF